MAKKPQAKPKQKTKRISPRIGHEIPGDVEQKYVGFCDILGFSRAIEENFDHTLALYADLTKLLSDMKEVFSAKVKLTMYSDALLLISDELPPLLSVIQNLSIFAAMHDFLLRGGIAYGKYWEQRHDGHLFVVSDALVEAVRIENQVSVPAVMISTKIQIPMPYWIPRFQNGSPFATALLHFRGMAIANPFGMYWGTTGGNKAAARRAMYPEHAAKYDWYLDLLRAMKANEPLVPQDALDWMLENGIVRSIPPEERAQQAEPPPGNITE